MKAQRLLGGGLGYEAWVSVDRASQADRLSVSHLPRCDAEGQRIAHIHPPIEANDVHAANIVGCNVGELICGVRWFE